MSYEVWLLGNDGEPVLVDNHHLGATHTTGKKMLARLTITSNLREFFIDHLDPKFGIMWLNGFTGKEAQVRLAVAVKQLDAQPDPDQWKPTKGNAGFMLREIYAWAKQHPKAVFIVMK
jgi:hypothetical protein